MLEPHDRVLMLEVLRPPAEFELDYAIGTTYSLDLLALLSVPLSFSRFDWESNNGEVIREPYALLEALRRHCDHMTVFCQGGAIYVPASANPLFAHIEDCVVQVSAPKGGIFHPKVWILRFRNDRKDILYRAVCLSRNITFDNSWDTSVVLEGPLVDRQNAIAANRPLADFVESLPALAANTALNKTRKKRISEISDELLRVSFELPRDFDRYRIWPLGIEHHLKSPLEDRLDRLLIVSPFVDNQFLTEIQAKGVRSVLISRIETLNALDPRSVSKRNEAYILSDGAQPEAQDTDESKVRVDNCLEGLHAKLYIVERGWNAHIFAGSANATGPGFETNVELLIELIGTKSKCGIDSFMQHGDKGPTTFADLLSRYVPSAQIDKADKESKHPEIVVEKAIRKLAMENLAAFVGPTDKSNEWALRIQAASERGVTFPPEIVRVSCWPVCIQEAMAVEVNSNQELVASFDGVSTNALSTFFAFKFFGKLRNKSLEMTRVITIPLNGAPKDRQERVLREMLQDKEQFLKFLFFILSDGYGNTTLGGDDGAGGEGFSWKWYGNDTLFETMVRALHVNPRRLDEIDRVIADLEKTPDGLSILPRGFREIWEPIRQAREGVEC